MRSRRTPEAIVVQEQQLRELTDPRAMRAFAHPLRMSLYELIALEGPLTATQCATRVGESPSSCSFHLRTLAKYGFLEDAGGGQGRNRPWRSVSRGHRWQERSEDPHHQAAAAQLTRVFVHRSISRILRWLDVRDHEPKAWSNAAVVHGSLLYATPEELASLGQAVESLLRPLVARAAHNAPRPEGAEVVEFHAFGFRLFSEAAA